MKEVVLSHMAQTVEISLRVPSLRVRREDRDAPETISNADVRFITRIEVASIPKPGTVITVGADPGSSKDCEVVRSDWSDDKNLFVVTCRYAKRSITLAEYQALKEAPGWEMRPLISG